VDKGKEGKKKIKESKNKTDFDSRMELQGI
jgi:hypothetical protein